MGPATPGAGIAAGDVRASPGASTAVWIAIEVLKRRFAGELKGWTAKLKQMIPSYGESLIEDAALCRRVRAET